MNALVHILNVRVSEILGQSHTRHTLLWVSSAHIRLNIELEAVAEGFLEDDGGTTRRGGLSLDHTHLILIHHVASC